MTIMIDLLRYAIKTNIPKEKYELMLVEGERAGREMVINEKTVYFDFIQRNPDQLQMLQGKSTIPTVVRQEPD